MATVIVEGVVSNLAAKALEGLGKAAFNKAESWWEAPNELKKLERTMKFIKARVRVAEQLQEDDSRDDIKEWLRSLKQVLYRADDLFDEVLTRDRQNQQMENSMVAGVRILFSESGPFHANMELASEIKSIYEELDAIKSDMDGLHLTVVPTEQLPPRIDHLIKKRETASVMNTDVVGRVEDQNRIIDMLDPKYNDQGVTVIPIVGSGGLGKTTLAQLVFNDERVRKHFDLSKWAYVPEKDNLIVIMGKIYKSFSGNNYGDLSLDKIMTGIMAFIEANNYLLVLDDLWDEAPHRLDGLFNLLKRGKQGSKVIVTTRLEAIAGRVCTIDKPYKLGTLTKEQSWDLFKKVTCKQAALDGDDSSFRSIGEEIVKMCGCVPLAIRIVGGFLSNLDTKEQWEKALEDQRSKALLTKDDEIMQNLKLSYYYLPPDLKQCFSYCSLLNKGDLLIKDELVCMWMALGYLKPPYEYNGDQNFLKLLARGFFQDPEFSDEGDIEYCKMHDLVHDLAECVAGEESKFLGDASSSQITDRLVHANLLQSQAPQSLFVATRMRSLLVNQDYDNSLEGLIEGFKYLRVLRIEEIEIEDIKLLNSIEKLIHLRYLNIESEDITHLPGSITRLPNLQTLVVDGCRNLKELPSDFVKLASLRHLLLPEYNDAFTDLPSEFGKLTSLQRLNLFHVGKSNGIDALPSLSFRGTLHIKFHGGRKNATAEAQRAKLKNNNQLTGLYLSYITAEGIPPFDEMNEMLMHLELPPNLEKLEVWNYKGYGMHSKWVDGLSKLVSITIMHCNCKVLPDLSQVPLLKYVRLEKLDELEYVEDEDNVGIGCGNLSTATHNNYFPSLEELELDNLLRLKGWTRASQDNREGRQLLFPNLLRLEVVDCPELMSMPIAAPKLESLVVEDVKWTVFGSNAASHEDGKTPASGSLSPFLSSVSKSLQKLDLCRVDLVSLSIGCKLNELRLSSCNELENLRFESPSSIRILDIYGCRRLRNIEGFQHLSALESLDISKLELEGEEEVEEEEEEEENTTTSKIKGWQWQALSSLRTLHLREFSNWKKLPSGIDCLTSLQDLYIDSLNNLKELPQDIGNLSSLRSLWIWGCPELKSLPTSLQGLPSLERLSISHCPHLQQRYKRPNEEDLHVIQHIPDLDIDELN